jgi:hypothetical protein
MGNSGMCHIVIPSSHFSSRIRLVEILRQRWLPTLAPQAGGNAQEASDEAKESICHQDVVGRWFSIGFSYGASYGWSYWNPHMALEEAAQ